MRRFVLALALSNLPFWLLGQFLFISRALVNLDVAIAICVLSRSRLGGVLLLLVAWGADWALSQSITFHFRTPLDFLDSFKFASEVELHHYATASAVALCLPFVAAVVGLLRLTRGRRQLWQPALVMTACLALLDVLNGSSMLSARGTWQLPVNIAGSPIATLGKLALNDAPDAPLRPIPTAETVQGLVDIPGWAQAHPEGSVLFVIVESMGSPTDARMQAWLDHQLIDVALSTKYEVRRAQVPFLGSTTSAELRSLCGLGGSYRKLDAAAGAGCLPAVLSRQGWSTVGMHGFSQQMFARQTWWPLMGLQTIQFVDSPSFTAARCGGAFRGGCDSDLISSGVAALAPGKRFVYLLTLNTHLPVEAALVPGEVAEACRTWRIDDDVCELTSKLGTLLRQISSALHAMESAPLVVIVGDHAPPFAARSARGAFHPHRVPAYALMPRH